MNYSEEQLTWLGEEARERAESNRSNAVRVLVIPFTYDDARVASLIWSKLREKGTLVSDADILIASIFLRHGEVLVSLDEDFQKVKELSRDWSLCC